jgi:ureidoglycolate lyase
LNAIKRNFSLQIKKALNHPFRSKPFIPLQKTNFIVVVAPISNEPDINLIETFLISPEEGINFKPKVWHFPLIATENSNFLTIDKKDSANNLEIYNFQNNDKIFLDYE